MSDKFNLIFTQNFSYSNLFSTLNYINDYLAGQKYFIVVLRIERKLTHVYIDRAIWIFVFERD